MSAHAGVGGLFVQSLGGAAPAGAPAFLGFEPGLLEGIATTNSTVFVPIIGVNRPTLVFSEVAIWASLCASCSDGGGGTGIVEFGISINGGAPFAFMLGRISSAGEPQGCNLLFAVPIGADPGGPTYDLVWRVLDGAFTARIDTAQGEHASMLVMGQTA